MKRIFYHATARKNIFSISHNGLRPSEDGYVTLCDSEEDAVCFGVDSDVHDADCFVVLKVLLDIESVERFQKYSFRSVVPITCYRYEGVVLPSFIALGESDISVFTYYANPDADVVSHTNYHNMNGDFVPDQSNTDMNNKERGDAI